MAGKKGASGRRKTPATIIKEAYDLIDSNMPSLFDKLYERAMQGDREALIYLIDRRLGKPKQQTDIDLKGGEQLGAGVVTRLFQILTERSRLLKEGETKEREDAIQGEGERPQLAQAEDEGTQG